MAGYKGQQGRKPKASTIKERLASRPGHEEVTLRRLPPPRSYLSDAAKDEWKRMGRYLIEIGMVSKLDLTALELYCVAYARHMEAEAYLQGPPGHCPNCDPRKEWDVPVDGRPACRGRSHLACEYGQVVRNHLGRLTPSPYLAIANTAWGQMSRILTEFGMTPASNPRVPRKEAARGQQRRVVTPRHSEDPRAALAWPVIAEPN